MPAYGRKPSAIAALIAILGSVVLPPVVAADDSAQSRGSDSKASGSAAEAFGFEVVGSDAIQARAMPAKEQSVWNAAFTLAMNSPNDYGYPWLEPGSETIRLTPITERGRAAAEEASKQFDREIDVEFGGSTMSIADLDRLSVAVTDLIAAGAPDANLMWRTEPDHLNNRLVVTMSDATPNLMRTLADKFGTERLAVRIEPAPDYAGPSARQDDFPPFYGGAKIFAPIGTCTTGFGWTANADKSTLFAGHCALAGGAVSYPSFPNVGTVTANAEENWSKTLGTVIFNGDNIHRGDIALIRYATLAATHIIYDGPPNTGINSDVEDFEWSAVGHVVCANGQADGENCGTVDRIGVTIHYTTQGPAVEGNNVFLRNVVEVTPSNWNQCPIPGDSGAPVYKKMADGSRTAKGIYSGTGGNAFGCEFWYTDIMLAIQRLPGTVQTPFN